MTGIPPRFTVRRYECLGSTSDEAKTLAAAGAPHGTVVVAREQTAGRGRLERAWFSPPGNLYLSAIFRPPLDAARATELGFVAAVAVADTVEACLRDGRRVTVKWPNDVLVNGAKIAGILAESQVSGHRIEWAVLGIGLNVASAPDDTPYPATSLQASAAGPRGVDEIIPLLLDRLGGCWDAWTRHGFGTLRAAWLRRAHRLGETIDVRLGASLVRGRFTGLDEDGALLLDAPGGRRRITVGEIL
jgi:BirA family biotin operon repressor/biotin-[acetyl-CoA-carboxylase] ligase